MKRLLAPLRAPLVAGLTLGQALLGACGGELPPPNPDPCAWLEVSFESSDPEQLVLLADHIEVLLDPTVPFVDDEGVPFPEGVVEGTGISFADVVTDDADLEMLVPLPLDAVPLPTLALDLGANVPIGFSMEARAIDVGGEVVAQSTRLDLIEIGACDVFSVTLSGLDPEVDPPSPTCSDGLDNDGDGWVDLEDPGCAGDPDGDEDDGFGANECNDGIDNDQDGLIDRHDTNCGSADEDDEGVPPLPPCSDGADNDGDGWVDLDDPGCAGDPLGGDEFSFSSLACSDGADNDGDGFADSDDPDCEDGYDDSEALVLAACEDGVDNDGDSWTDGADPGCDSPTDDNEGNAGSTECNDGLDNDGDGFVDSADPECASALTDSEVPVGDDDDSAGDDDDSAGDDDDSAALGDDDDSAGDDDDSAALGDDDDSAALGDDDDSAGDDDDSAALGDDDDSAGDDDDSAALGDDDDSAGDDDDSAAAPVPYTFTEVFGVISGGCACHAGASHSTGFAFSGDAATLYGLVVDTPAFETALTSGLDRIEPGASLDSYLMHKLDGTQVGGTLSDGVTLVQGIGDQMPLSGTPLSLEVRDRIRAWIDAGAPNN